MALFTPLTVDSIVKSFTDTLTKLEQVAANHTSNQDKFQKLALEAVTAADTHAKEAERARSIHSKISNLLA